MSSKVLSWKTLVAISSLALLLLGTLSGDVAHSAPAQSNQLVWTKVQTASSPPAGVGMLAFDSQRQRSVAFTENGETWEYDGANWVRKNTATSPSPRLDDGGMAYDTGRGRVVLFGGLTEDSNGNVTGYLNDTWEYDGASWVRKNTATSPPQLSNHTLAYDSTRRRIVLFGGSTADNTYTSDTWEYDGTNWVRKSTAASPPPRGGAGMTYDSTRGQVVLFGGYAGTGDFSLLNDTWVYDGATWRQKTTVDSPSGRDGASLTFDPTRNRVLLFGGGSDGPEFNDTWEYDGANWVNVTPPDSGNSPFVRFRSGMAYDSIRHKVVLFGGGGSDSPVTTQAHTLVAPQQMLLGSLFSPLFGITLLNDTWEYGSQGGGSPHLVITKVEYSPNNPVAYQPSALVQAQAQVPLALLQADELRDVCRCYLQTAIGIWADGDRIIKCQSHSYFGHAFMSCPYTGC
jgi:Galactose oxidase, central domain